MKKGKHDILIMNILHRNNSFELLFLALAEHDIQKRYTLMNTVAEAFAHGETNIERSFSAICYELNGEPHAALNCMTSYTVKEENQEMYFAHACIALWHAIYIMKSQEYFETAKQIIRKAILLLRKERNFRELGILLKILKMLLMKNGFQPEDFFKNIDLPSIVILKIFTPSIPYVFSNDSFQLSLEIVAKLKDETAVIISSCTNVLEQKMLKTFLEYGIKPICAPLMPLPKLRETYRNQEGEDIATTMSDCEMLEPISDYSPKETEVWPLVEEYGVRYLLGLGLLYKEKLELPIRYVWETFTTSYLANDMEALCINNRIDITRIGG